MWCIHSVWVSSLCWNALPAALSSSSTWRAPACRQVIVCPPLLMIGFSWFFSTVSQRQRPNNSVLETKQQALQYDPPSQLHLVTPAPTLALCRCLKIEKKKNTKEKSRDKCEGRDKKLRKIDGQKMTGMQHACLSPFRSFVYMWPYRWTPCTFHSGNSRIPTPKAAPKWPPIRRLPGAPQLLRYMKGLTQNSLGLLRMFAAMFALFCIRMEHIGTSHFITALWVLDSCRHEVVQACARDKAPRAFDFVYCLRWSMIKSSI